MQVANEEVSSLSLAELFAGPLLAIAEDGSANGWSGDVAIDLSAFDAQTGSSSVSQ